MTGKEIHPVFEEFFATSRPLVIAGPCVLETEDIAVEIGAFMKKAVEEVGFLYCFKASYDKANRTSVKSYRGPGLEAGLTTLKKIGNELKCPVISDVHEVWQVGRAKEVLDSIQIPAFLSRQTDLLVEAGNTGLPVNIKKGQFLAPWDMKYSVEKVRSTGNEFVMVTERGAQFGYNNLVVDMRSIPIMKGLGVKVVFDATHSVQLPGGGAGCSSGQREFAPVLARSAFSAGADAIFMEVHVDPEKALCDGPNSLYLSQAKELLKDLAMLDKIRGGFSSVAP